MYGRTNCSIFSSNATVTIEIVDAGRIVLLTWFI